MPRSGSDGDISVGDLVSRRFGKEVMDRLVEPLLGGVYAGHAAVGTGDGAAARRLRRARFGAGPGPGDPHDPGPGIRRDRRRPRPVAGRAGEHRSVRGPDGCDGSGLGWWRPASSSWPGRRATPSWRRRVVLRVPAAPTSRLLAGLTPSASEDLAAIEYASMAVVTMAFRASSLASLSGPRVGVPGAADRRSPDQGGHLLVRQVGLGAGGRCEDDVLVLRTSLGRHREESSLQRTDQELVEVSWSTWPPCGPADRCAHRRTRAEMGWRTSAVRRGPPRPGGPDPGRRSRIAGLAVCGAAYDGVGIPAVIASARRAVAEVTAAQ